MKRCYDNGAWLLYTESPEEASAMMHKFKRRSPAVYSRHGEKYAWSWTFTRQEYRDFFREDKPSAKLREYDAESIGILDEVPLGECFIADLSKAVG